MAKRPRYKDSRCRYCKGRGKFGVRFHVTCPHCQGSGKRSDEIARTLSGENDPWKDSPWKRHDTEP